jgi:hypothetical protein
MAKAETSLVAEAVIRTRRVSQGEARGQAMDVPRRPTHATNLQFRPRGHAVEDADKFWEGQDVVLVDDAGSGSVANLTHLISICVRCQVLVGGRIIPVMPEPPEIARHDVKCDLDRSVSGLPRYVGDVDDGLTVPPAEGGERRRSRATPTAANMPAVMLCAANRVRPDVRRIR